MSAQDDLEEELRKRYGREVPILHQFPPKDEIIAKESWLERIAGLAGLQGWMWRSRWGLIIALIVVPPTVHGYIDFYRPILKTGIEYAEPYIGALKATSINMGGDLVAFLEPEPSQEGGFGVPRALIVPTAQENLIHPIGVQPFLLDTTLWRYSSMRRGSPIDGRASTYFDGRWHTRRPSLLYTSDSLLANLEEIRHRGATLFPRDLALHELRVRTLAETAPPEAVRAVAEDDWIRTQAIGNAWAEARLSGALVAPSRLVLSSHTVILNLALIDQMRVDVLRIYPILT